jgi:hypothetical protein
MIVGDFVKSKYPVSHAVKNPKQRFTHDGYISISSRVQGIVTFVGSDERIILIEGCRSFMLAEDFEVTIPKKTAIIVNLIT